jgi:splicing suppressor protein 51
MWEDTMARVAQEHEELQNRIGQSEDRRKRTKKALREALENASGAISRPLSQGPSPAMRISDAVDVVKEMSTEDKRTLLKIDDTEAPNKAPIVSELTALSETESDEEEFFDAVDAGEIEVVVPPKEEPVVAESSNLDIRAQKESEIVPSYRGYEDGVRKRLNMDSDDRPKISLWVCSTTSRRFRGYAEY